MTPNERALSEIDHAIPVPVDVTSTTSAVSKALQLTTGLFLLATYVGIVLYFSYVNVYNDHFFDGGHSTAYNLARIAFGFFLFAILCTSGSNVVHALQRITQQRPTLGHGESVIVNFIAGAIFWQFLMLLLGYLFLYTRTIAFAATLPFVAQSSLAVAAFTAGTYQSFRNLFQTYNIGTRLVAAGFVVTLAFVALSLLLVKGLYPAGGHDYFTHYFYYYTTVLKNHSIWPNDVWYHYFYSKGEGIIFLSMLLTDPLAPSIVTYCFVIIGALALFIFIDRMRTESLWPWAAVICYLSLLIYAGGETGLNIDNKNYWAEFSKEHEINAAYVMVFAYICDRILRSPEAERRLFVCLAVGICISVSFLEEPTPIFLGLLSITLAAAQLFLRNPSQAFRFFTLACASGVGLISNIALNYATTGIPNDVLINVFWSVINLHKIERIGWIFPVIKHSLDLTGVSIGYDRGVANLPRNLASYLRLAFLQPWFGYIQGAIFSFGTALILCVDQKRIPAEIRPTLLIVGSVFFSFFVAAATLGASLPDSFYRYASFILPFEFIAGAMVWTLIGALIGAGWVGTLLNTVLPGLAASLVLSHLWTLNGSHLSAVIQGGINFFSGRYSIYDAYVAQAEWPSRMPYGAIYPGSLKVWEKVGRGTRVWSFHIHSYCMLPGCRFESDESFPMSPHMFEILFGPGDQAREILHREGLDYFLFSRELYIADIRSAVGLFSPGNIGKYLGVKWTDGTTYLLTWLGPGIQPLSPEWLADYRKQALLSREGMSFLNSQASFRAVFKELKAHPTWGRQVDLPWLH